MTQPLSVDQFRELATNMGKPRLAASSWDNTRSCAACLIGILAGGHVLLEGVPGLGKTMLIRTLAQVLDLKILAHSVHTRSDARRHRGHRNLD